MRRQKSLILPAALALLLASALAGCASLGVREGGFNLVSLDEEWAMRDDLQKQVAQQMKVVNDRAALDYLNRIGRRLAGQTPLGNRRWDFGIVASDDLNAFNLPGGLVYVNSGLIREAESLDQLTGVLAHEVAHGAARHGTQLLTRSYGVNAIATIVLGKDPGAAQQLLAQLVGTGVLLDYSRDAENEADQLGVGYAYRAGYDPKGMAVFFGRLLAERQRRPGRVEQFFSSHPLTEERIENVQATIAGLPAKRNLTHDTQDYQRFRSRFR